MTNREMLENVVNGTITAETVEKAQAELAKLDEVNAHRAKAKAEKKAAVDNPLIEQATEIFSNATAPMTASELAKALDITTSKATVIAKAVEGITITDIKVKGGRSVKGYSLN